MILLSLLRLQYHGHGGAFGGRGGVGGLGGRYSVVTIGGDWVFCLSVFLSVCLPACLSVCLSVSKYVCMALYISIVDGKGFVISI